MENFDLKKYLVEGKLLKEEEISPQEALPIAKKVASKVKDTPEFEKVVDAISKDPKATSELLKLIGLNEGEGITEDVVDKLALQFAKKVEDNPEIIKEEGGFDYGGALWTGLIGGGTLANYAASLADPIAQSMSHNPSYMVATVIGAVGGAILAVLGKRLYDKIKKKTTNEHKLNENTYNAFDDNPKVRQVLDNIGDATTTLRKLGNEAYGGEKKNIYSSEAGAAFEAFDKALSNLDNALQSVDVKLSK